VLGVLVSLCSIGAGALGVAVLSLPKSLSVFHMAFARPERIVEHSQNQARVRVSPASQLKREWSLWPELGWNPGNLRGLSRG
jgi:hypothetical protein